MPTPKAKFDITAQDKTKGAFTSVNKSLGGLKTAFAALGAGITFAGISTLVKETLNANDNIAKLSQSTGLGVEALNSYDLAAQLAGTNIEQFSKGVGRLQRSMFDSVAGLKESAEAFEAMGVEIQKTDGTLRDTEDVLLDVADKFETYEDGASKAALAQRLFGRGGVALIPLLNQGADAIRAYTEENRALGNVLTEDVAKASERVNDNFARLGTAVTGTGRQIVEGLVGPLETVTNQLVEFSKESGNAALIVGQTLGGALKGLATGILVIKNAFDIVIDTFRSTGAAIASLAAGDWRSALDLLTEGGRDMMSEYEDIIEGVGTLWFEVSTDILQNADDTSDKIAAPLVLAAEKTKKATKEIKDEVDAAFALIDAQFAKLDKQEAIKLAGLEGPSADDTARAAVFEATRTPAEKLSAEIERLNMLFDNGARDFDTYSRAMFDAQDEFDSLSDKAEETGEEMSQFAIQAARSVQSAFADFLFDPFGEENDNMVQQFADTMRRIAAEAASQAILGSVTGALAGGAGGGFFASLAGLFGGPQKLAGGTNSARGGLSLVGERGPELVNLPRGAQVIPNNELGGIGGMTFNVSVQGQVDNRTGTQIGLDAARAFNLASVRNA